jgi:hypothetical protein
MISKPVGVIFFFTRGETGKVFAGIGGGNDDEGATDEAQQANVMTRGEEMLLVFMIINEY